MEHKEKQKGIIHMVNWFREVKGVCERNIEENCESELKDTKEDLNIWIRRANKHRGELLKGCGGKVFDEDYEFDYICGTDELTRFMWEGVSEPGASYAKGYCEDCLKIINEYDKILSSLSAIKTQEKSK